MGDMYIQGQATRMENSSRFFSTLFSFLFSNPTLTSSLAKYVHFPVFDLLTWRQLPPVFSPLGAVFGPVHARSHTTAHDTYRGYD